nr:chemotaxis response regulator protein-glutamate methylesterase [Cohnella algarum]
MQTEKGGPLGVNRAIKVLIVDDSLMFREVIAKAISTDPRIEVVGTAADPFEARDKIVALRPDVMTCDVEMPKMNGIEFIRRLLPQYPIPVVVVSGAAGAGVDAMVAGAVDVVKKPDTQSPGSVEAFIRTLIATIKVASAAKVGAALQKPPEPAAPAAEGQRNGNSRFKVIAVGASTGGTEAVLQLLKRLPNTVPGLVVVQHIPVGFSRMFADRLNQSTAFRVKEAQSGDEVVPGSVLIAPGDRHMKLKKSGDGFKVECFEGDKVNGHCPSVDVLFDSAAKECGGVAIGVLLTGMGYDGARGLLAMRRKGARTFGQDEKTSVVYGMPRVAYELGAVEKQLPIERIPQAVVAQL